MATNTVPKLTETDLAVRKLRNPAPFRGFAATLLTGLMNSGTGFGLFKNGVLDLFAAAAAVAEPGKDPFNNFLGKDAKPQVTIYPKAIGLYVGDIGIDAERVRSIIAENSILTIEQENAVVLRQPTLTIPPGIVVAKQVAVSTTVAASQLAGYAEQFGPSHAVGLFELPKNVVFEKGKTLAAKLKIGDAALAYLMTKPIAIHGAGMPIGVMVYGVAEYELGTNR
jgi:hypothetical protein